ncbi:MAG TPA: hypothetical protein VNB86_01350 [Gaiellaceae bacterium]|jgi:hypothetical protein|nr:hypothetical protein [Gaiellaceae bacterium]
MKRWLAVAAAFVVGLAVTAGVAGGAVVSGTRNAHDTTSYVSVSYNTQYCSLRKWNLFHITSVEYRWHRNTTARRITNAVVHFGQTGFPCTGLVGGNGSAGENLGTLCWACGNSTSTYWSNDFYYYQSPRTWGWVGPGPYPVIVGAWTKYTVRNASGTALTTQCHQVYVAGIDGC